MKKYLFIILISLILSCKKDLTGHWHTKFIGDDSFDTSIDILKNNKCYLYYSLSSKPIKGIHFPDKKQLYIPGDCGVFMFEYELKKDKLFLTNALGSKLIAEKQDKKCSRFKDYKSILPINFLTIKNKRELLKPKDSIENEGLNEYFLINSKNDKIRLEFFDKINPVNKIDSIIKYIENTHSDSEIPFINYVLVPDKNLKISDLKFVINEFNKGHRKKIFIQTLKINPKEMSVFEYIKIDKLDLDSDNTLNQIIF